MLDTATDPDIEALIAAFYSTFENRNGRTPTDAVFLTMFSEGATISRVANGVADRWTPQAFIAPRIKILTDGTLTDFHEWEVAARTFIHNDIAHRWSNYAKEGMLDGADYRGEGYKAIQLRKHEGRWLIQSILWEDA